MPTAVIDLGRIQSRMLAISIRQPWAHRILYEGKNIENRKWPPYVFGPVLIHASLKIDPEQAEAVTPDMPRGGIVGAVEIDACVRHSDSPWFTGPYGFLLKNPIPLSFIPCPGRLRFFRPPIDPEQIVLAA